MRSITTNEFSNIFQGIGKELILLSAKKDGRANAMTAGWGGIGVMWGRDVAFAVIRPSRYTKEFVDSTDHFSLSFFGENADLHAYFGKVSGRDEDKIAKYGLTLMPGHDAPCFEEAKFNIVCKKLYAQPLEKQFLTDGSIDARWYPQHDYHTLYFGEIKEILAK